MALLGLCRHAINCVCQSERALYRLQCVIKCALSAWHSLAVFEEFSIPTMLQASFETNLPDCLFNQVFFFERRETTASMLLIKSSAAISYRSFHYLKSRLLMPRIYKEHFLEFENSKSTFSVSHAFPIRSFVSLFIFQYDACIWIFRSTGNPG